MKKQLLKEEYGCTRGQVHIGSQELGLNKTATDLRQKLSDFEHVSLYVDQTSPKSVDKSIVVDLTDYEVNGKTVYVFVSCEGNDTETDTYSYQVISVDGDTAKKTNLGQENDVTFDVLVNDLKVIVQSLVEIKAEMEDEKPEALNESHELGLKLSRLNKVLHG